MDTYETLIARAEEDGILVVPGGAKTACLRMDGACAIFVDEARYPCRAALEEAFAHELGHCEEGAFYTSESLEATVLKCEYMADCRAVLTLLPLRRLREILEGGARELHEIAAEAGRSEAFVRRAVEIYRAKGLLDAEDG